MLASGFDQGLQRIIGAALVDNRIVTTLVDNPLALADQFYLTLPERRLLVGVSALDLEHFADLVERWSHRALALPTSPKDLIEMV